MRINSEIDILGLDLDNTLTFRIKLLPWWCSGILSPFLTVLPPNKPILEMIREFKKSGGKIVVISSRPKFLLKLSILWLKHYKVPYHKIKCVGFIDRSRKKLEVIRTEKINYFIDDDCTVRNFLKENEPSIEILDPFVMV